MPATDLAERLAGIRILVDRVFQILVRPTLDALEQCEALLGAALADFESSRPLWGVAGGSPTALAEASKIRAAVAQAGRLLEAGAAYHRRWYRLLATRSGGYNSRGAPVELRAQGRISLQG